jgi:hypothetical protein
MVPWAYLLHLSEWHNCTPEEHVVVSASWEWIQVMLVAEFPFKGTSSCNLKDSWNFLLNLLSWYFHCSLKIQLCIDNIFLLHDIIMPFILNNWDWLKLYNDLSSTDSDKIVLNYVRQGACAVIYSRVRNGTWFCIDSYVMYFSLRAVNFKQLSVLYFILRYITSELSIAV